MSEATDVLVVGGGPAGAVCAASLAARGVRVTVLEKERFPRFRLGESLLPQSMPVFADLGVLDALEEGFLPKYGARFHDDVGGVDVRHDRFPFSGAWKSPPDHAFQVPRDAFDALLLDHARGAGADVREGWSATRLLRDGERTSGVVARMPDGSETAVRARFVVDASGRAALSAHAARGTEKIPGLDQTAFYAHFEGVRRGQGKEEGDIDIVLFREHARDRPSWFWVIPFKDGRASVGAVVSRAWVGEARADAADPDALFARAVERSPTARALLAGARKLWPSARAAADFSYRVGALASPGLVAVGDAGGFLDPLFSSGVHLAVVGARGAAEAIALALGEPAREADVLAAWERRTRTGTETFLAAVRAFYAGPLVEFLFADNKHTALRRSVTSLLAGDVFGDAVWLRDARRRVAEMAGER